MAPSSPQANKEALKKDFLFITCKWAWQMELSTFIREPLALSLLSVPGIDETNVNHLMGKGITNTHQLLGQFLLFHAHGVDADQLLNRFSLWLIKLGVTTNTNAIASAVAQKVGTWVQGVYSSDSDSWDLCSDVGNTSTDELKNRYETLVAKKS